LEYQNDSVMQCNNFRNKQERDLISRELQWLTQKRETYLLFLQLSAINKQAVGLVSYCFWPSRSLMPSHRVTG